MVRSSGAGSRAGVYTPPGKLHKKTAPPRRSRKRLGTVPSGEDQRGRAAGVGGPDQVDLVGEPLGEHLVGHPGAGQLAGDGGPRSEREDVAADHAVVPAQGDRCARAVQDGEAFGEVTLGPLPPPASAPAGRPPSRAMSSAKRRITTLTFPPGSWDSSAAEVCVGCSRREPASPPSPRGAMRRLPRRPLERHRGRRDHHRRRDGHDSDPMSQCQVHGGKAQMPAAARTRSCPSSMPRLKPSNGTAIEPLKKSRR